MNANNIQTPPKIKRETKNKIKVEFDRTPLIERLQAKLLNINFVINVLWYIFRVLRYSVPVLCEDFRLVHEPGGFR